ncbi:LOW QUALITY PROTEIN: urotensin 1 [Syngnathoides biaculeatus]|uniref:LOW QUALITY PROTEIN: urotensin 1 n=1 Tax=Syngnathoides biaculeatus TaxID=300417 RepID=UPI002ADD658F|nr:LOW QUALITY PROTEIN: urotensin 1 [Syngnathoides biaculeatus]
MKCWSSLLLSSLVLDGSSSLPGCRGPLRTPQPARTAATDADLAAARLLSFRVPELFLGATPEDDDDDDDDGGDDVEGYDDAPKFEMRREPAPLSIDLTFHLLRNMIHNARTEEHRMRAELNRKMLDDVGK